MARETFLVFQKGKQEKFRSKYTQIMKSKTETVKISFDKFKKKSLDFVQRPKKGLY